ncbi:MAG: bifunctional UDP-4-keto-pentose/UDP-xylose synthase [Planctomycetes bacterium]|nr:bifunctional UDP-4-keto-pentose/UDP-xylose synthase [Planctomycetota bacterium]
MKVLILGINGFIGNALAERLLADKNESYEVYGLDLFADKLDNCLNHERFHFVEGDLSIYREWVQYHIKVCDVVFPLVAIATPADYLRRPLEVFELGFEENLRVVRLCIDYGKRVIFPSTSEVYGMCGDKEFDEDTSCLVTGPIRMQRWIYSTSKQLLDRVIWAYGQAGKLRFTLFRPFNWIGPKLDSLDSARIGSSRVITQFIMELMDGHPIRLVDGGEQSRCFTYLDDGIECLMKIVENKDGAADGQIFNVGNPGNECSVADLARKLVTLYTERIGKAPSSKIITVSSEKHYGKGYQDMVSRKPSIKKAQKLLGWKPKVGLDDALRKTLHYFVDEKTLQGSADKGSTSSSKDRVNPGSGKSSEIKKKSTGKMQPKGRQAEAGS